MASPGDTWKVGVDFRDRVGDEQGLMAPLRG